MGRTYYDLLQVSRDAPSEVVSAAYRAQMLKLKKHPDLGGDVHEAALINEAYEVLTDATRRAAYDASLAPSVTPPVPQAVARPEERRREPRLPTEAAVSYCLDHDHRWCSARALDVSSRGIKLRSHEPFEIGSDIIIMPPNLASCSLQGTVRWSRVYHPSIFERVFEAGVEFSGQVEDIQQRFL